MSMAQRDATTIIRAEGIYNEAVSSWLDAHEELDGMLAGMLPVERLNVQMPINAYLRKSSILLRFSSS
jgi:hypothetical protein